MGFEANRVLPGITHIRDCMGVCMTLIEGEKAAWLVDTGYGVENVADFIRTLTDKPLTVILTHHHHDHTLGVRWFDEVFMLPADKAEWAVFNGQEKRRAVFQQAIAKGLPVTESEFLAGECPQPRDLSTGCFDLGGLTLMIMACPGHTPGSCVVYIPERRLLLTGDDWNPCTWLFFEAALPVQEYRENVRRLQALEFDHVLCSHQPELYPRSKFDDFVNHLSDDVLGAAQPVTIGGYEHIATRQANVTQGQILVFDWNKAKQS